MVAANAAQSALKEKVKELQARAREAATANDKLVSAKLVNPEVGLAGKQHLFMNLNIHIANDKLASAKLVNPEVGHQRGDGK